jgi:hypothetical protein
LYTNKNDTVEKKIMVQEMGGLQKQQSQRLRKDGIPSPSEEAGPGQEQGAFFHCAREKDLDYG